MGSYELVFPIKTKFGVAANILNAEYNLKNLSPELNKQAFHYLIDYLSKNYRLDGPDEAYRHFLRKSRDVQLNILALAYNSTNIAPLLNGEYWTHVKRPMLPTIYDQSVIAAVSNRMARQHGVEIYLPDYPVNSDELAKKIGIQ